VAVHDGGHLPDSHAIGDCYEQMVAGLRQIGRHPVSPHRLIEHAFGDAVENAVITRSQKPVFNLNGRISAADRDTLSVTIDLYVNPMIANRLNSFDLKEPVEKLGLRR